MKKAPRIVRQTVPSPPAIEVPPTTMAAITENTNERSSEGVAEMLRDARSTPARAAATAASTNTLPTIQRTRTPVSRAASTLPPTA